MQEGKLKTFDPIWKETIYLDNSNPISQKQLNLQESKLQAQKDEKEHHKKLEVKLRDSQQIRILEKDQKLLNVEKKGDQNNTPLASKSKRGRKEYQGDTINDEEEMKILMSNQSKDKSAFQEDQFSQYYLKSHAKSLQPNDSPAKSERSSQTGGNGRSLYDEAVYRQYKQQMINKQVDEEAKRQTNESKIAPNSQKIILKKIQEFLQALVVSLSEDLEISNEEEANNKEDYIKTILRFERVGSLLSQLGVFKCLQFIEDENGEVSINQLKQLHKSEIVRMKNEMRFHEEFWKILCLNQCRNLQVEEVIGVSSVVVFEIVLVLLELKLTPNQSQLILEQILIARLFSEEIEEGQHLLSLHQQNKNNWSVNTLIREFRKLFDDKTVLMESYSQWNKSFSNTSQTSRDSYNQNMSFQPQINNRSRVMDSFTKLARNDSDKQRHQLLFEHHQEHLEKIKEQISEKLCNEAAECTFTPQINNQSKKVGSQEESLSDCSQLRHEKLFSIYLKQQQETQALKQQEDTLKAEKEIENCTFKPQINSFNSEILTEGILEQQVKGLNEQLKRMQKARNVKKEKDEFFSRKRQELASAREKHKQQQKFVSPLAVEKKAEEKVEVQDGEKKILGFVVVNVTKTKKGRVVLRQGDNATQLAQNFARIYKLTEDLTETLAEMLQAYLNRFQ